MNSNDDIVRRLRNPGPLDGLYSLCRSAALEIETLRARLDDFDEWVRVGVDKQWVTSFCFTHDRYPFDTLEEAERVENDEIEGGDPCLPAVRLTRTPPEVRW